MKGWWHLIWIVVLVYVIAYYWRAPGDMTIGKLYPAAS